VSGNFFANNSASIGGGIYNDGSGILNENDGGTYNAGVLTVSNSIFINNSANDGGGIYNDSGGMLTVKDDIFANNTATNGGGIYNAGTLINTGNLFFDNTGGNIYS